MPHGGPEMRDALTFDPWVQYLVARGYAVFQPNFRGSDGFGKRVRRERLWRVGPQDAGRPHRWRQSARRPAARWIAARVCIVGASYGGYAALAGAALTPDLYKCAVSIAGISDLDDFIGWRKRNWGIGFGGLYILAQGHRRPEEGQSSGYARSHRSRKPPRSRFPCLLDPRRVTTSSFRSLNRRP